MNAKQVLRRYAHRVWKSSTPTRARDVLRHYVRNVEDFWDGATRIQAEKLNQRLDRLCQKRQCTADEALEWVLDVARRRTENRPPPLYVTGLGGSGSRWLAGMVRDLGGFATTGEVYFPARLLESMSNLGDSAQGFVADAIHLLHSGLADARAESLSLINAAAAVERIPNYRQWDVACAIVYLVRQPYDQVLSVTFRKQAYRGLVAPGVSDTEYLVSRARRNRASYIQYRGLSTPADVVCRYEDLKRDPKPTLERIQGAFHLEADAQVLERVLFRHDARNIRAGLTKRTGNLDQGGVSQGWRGDATDDQKRILHAELAEVVTGLSYQLSSCVVTDGNLGAGGARSLELGDGTGEVFIRKAGEDVWSFLGPARGRVRVASDKELLLRIGNEAAQTPATLDRLGPDDLQTLCLSGNRQTTDRWMPSVVRLTGLRELDLSRTRITDAGAKTLSRLTHLRGLNLWDTKVTAASIEYLKRELPGCTVFAGAP